MYRAQEVLYSLSINSEERKIMMTPKMSKKVYTSGYWQAARELEAHEFGKGAEEIEARYLQGYKAGSLAIEAGRAQRTMVWSTERRGMPKVRRILVLGEA
jgi:hypothetical protein